MASFEQAFRILTARSQEKDHEHAEGRKLAVAAPPTDAECHEQQRSSVQINTSGVCPPVDISSWTPLQLLQRFQKLQSERVAIYNEFEDHFKLYLDDGNVEMFQHASQLVTQGFAQCSANIRAVAAALSERQRDDLGELIRSVQQFEKEKLRLLLLEQASFSKRSEGYFAGDQLDAEVDHVRQQLNTLRAQINDVLEEIRYAIADL